MRLFRMALLQRRVPKIVAVFGTNRGLAEAWLNPNCKRNVNNGQGRRWIVSVFSCYVIYQRTAARMWIFAIAMSCKHPWRARLSMQCMHLFVRCCVFKMLANLCSQNATGVKWLAGQIWLCVWKCRRISYIQPGTCSAGCWLLSSFWTSSLALHPLLIRLHSSLSSTRAIWIHVTGVSHRWSGKTSLWVSEAWATVYCIVSVIFSVIACL